MKRIHDSLQIVFQRHRLVFWYDPERQWEQAYESFDDASVTKLRVEGAEFGAKVTIHRDPNRDARYLLYFPSPRPPDSENWLLDMLLQGHEYKADRASLAVQEAGLTYDALPVVEQHIKFFDSARRAEAFRALARPDDDPRALRLKMMAVLTGAEPEVDALLLWFLDKGAGASVVDPVEEFLGTAGLAEYLWTEVRTAFGYTSEHPSLRDFVTILFRWANPLESGVALASHAKVFLQQWKDSRDHSAAFRQWSDILAEALRVEHRLDELSDPQPLGSSDVFAAFDQFCLNWLCKNFERVDNAILLEYIQTRRASFWFGEHANGYEAVARAVELRELVAAADLRVDSIDNGINRYAERWYRIDTAYRQFCYHQRCYGQVALLERIVAWVERTYVNSYLLPLTDRWNDQVRLMPAWQSTRTLPQTAFFDHYVRPFLARKLKVFVVISDALRFEAAAEFVTRLRAENRWTAELDAMLAGLPSYTQLGMAALLPGDERDIQLADRTVLLDGKPTAGTPARGQLLAGGAGIKARAIQAKEFLGLNTKTDARALLRDHDVVYIYHDVIDERSHSKNSEETTAENVEAAIVDLLQILRKLYNANAYNMLVTADHGFLFQQSGIDGSDDLALPDATEWLVKDRRFALGRGIVPHSSVKMFDAPQLGLIGDWQAAFPLGLSRFPLSGAGKRYVHGGISLQEVVVPVVRIHVARSDDTEAVEVDLLRVPSRITTGQVNLSLYQSRPVADKVLPRTLRVGVFTADGTPLSEAKALTFDSTDPEPRQRETNVTLVLSRAADDYNNQDVEIRLDEMLAGTTQTVTYKKYLTRLLKRFTSDFDE